MTSYFKILLFVSLAVMCNTILYATYDLLDEDGNFIDRDLLITDAEGNGVTLYTSENILNIPLAKVNDRYVANARLRFESNGQFVVEGFKEIPDSQQAMVEKLQSLPCGKADTLGRWAARNAFLKGDESYCLVKGPMRTFEAGIFYTYLLIENGTAQTIDDTRRDLQCCFDIVVTGGETQVKFGYVENGELIEVTELSQIDFEREHQLRLIGDIVLEF